MASPGYAFGWGSLTASQLGSEWRYRPYPISRLGLVIALAAGANHGLALKRDGSVRTWGDNAAGQLGDGTRVPSGNPIGIGLGNVTALAAGENHSLTLQRDGSVRAWGRNQEGQLGDGSTTDRARPVRAGVSRVITLAAGRNHSLAVTSDGRVWAWGDNGSGQLGTGIAGTSSTPTPVAGLGGVMAVKGGANHSLALRVDGTVWTWGRNNSGQLGTGTTVDSPAPTRVTGLPRAVAIAAGAEFSVALARDGTVWAWGSNQFRELGGTAPAASEIPRQVSGIQDLVDIQSGGAHTLGLKADGTVWVWGSPVGPAGEPSGPVLASGLSRVVAVAAGGDSSLALSEDIDVVGWGSSNYGQVGEVAVARNRTPVAVSGLGGAQAVAAGSEHSLALRKDAGSLWAWGSNAHGQLGVVTTHSGVSTPLMVSAATVVVAIAAGANHNVALREDGSVLTWGNSVSGQLGDGVAGYYLTRATPMLVTSLDPARAVAAGLVHSLAALRNGTVRAWGSNVHGQVGDGTGGGSPDFVAQFRAPYVRARPVQVLDLVEIVSVAAGSFHSLALKDDGTVWAWGSNVSAELGNGTMGGIQNAPAQIGGLAGAIAIAAGARHSLALAADGTVWAWGANGSGQLGNGTVGGTGVTPGAVPGLSDVVAVAAGGHHSLALKGDGTVWSWGANGHGQLGIGAADARRPTPTQVVGLTGVRAIAAGHSHSLAIRTPA